ncbi:efflux RND transporter periplasmic adaptor subunit [Solwaraspora sp. WMMD791]|uniref:efflux RND transporter periplasmic adaptor subunit n=1 Tax=Solwaraspora sp. WMMD791 TaxID=3016086 RepID=UPI00249C7752|nr:efflux RND transporter periplasmic adaptor subunit [Solwaraspora sp. WMMD791]WFE25853.1 efflux RND transporter periplasmic adaptor subunit [Solwaraspora sp. WMMD791]
MTFSRWQGPAWRWRGGRRLAVAAVGATLTMAGAFAYGLTGASRADETDPVTTARVDRGPVTVEIAAAASVQPAQDRQLSFAVAGTVNRLDVRLGQDVAAGDVLASIDDGDAVTEVEQAQAELADAQDVLAAARQAATDDVAGGDGAASDGCATTLTGTAVRLGSTSAVVTTSAGLAAGTTPEPTADASPSASPTPTPGAPSSPGPASTATVGPVPTASTTPTPPTSPSASSVPTGRSTPQSDGTGTTCRPSDAQSGTGSGGTGSGGGDQVLRAQQQVTAAELRLAAAEDELAGTVIRAPMDGKVLAIAGAVGSTVRAGGTFIELAAVAEMQVTASFPEADAARLAVGQPAVVTLPTRPDAEFPARVGQLDPVGTVDGQLVRYGVLIDFDEVPADLLVGQSASVRIVVDEVADVVRIPVTALRGDGGEDVVIVRVADGGQQRRVVVVGVRGDRYVEVVDGLTVDEEIVSSGAGGGS